jgi:hypothetical protein
MISSDTSQSYNVTSHVPSIEPFSDLKPEQRRSLVFFYEAYIAQAQSDLRRLRLISASNINLQKMVNAILKD